MKSLVKRFANDESGATAIEYGLIAAGISVAIITVLQRLGSLLRSDGDRRNRCARSAGGRDLGPGGDGREQCADAAGQQGGAGEFHSIPLDMV